MKSSCDRSGSKWELYVCSCRHLTLCFSYKKAMAEIRPKCKHCCVLDSKSIRDKSAFVEMLQKVCKIRER